MSKFRDIATQVGSPEEVDVEFGEWLPDMSEFLNAGAVEALNVIPSEGSYVPFKRLWPVEGLLHLPESCRGGINLFSKTGESVLFAGTGTGLYKRDAGVFTKLYTAPYTLYDDYYWQFVQFGDNIVMLHPQVVPQVGDVGGYVAFSPLGGTPPIAQCGGRVGDFLVLGNLDNEPGPDAARQPRRIRWSGFNNIEAPWTTDPATQADFNDMPAEGGEVMGITGREFGSVFQARSISRMAYVGLPTVFDIETVETARGALATSSIVDVGAMVFFIADDGFYVWNGTNSTPIGDMKVNKWFATALNYDARHRICGAYDPVNKCVMWAFPTGTSGALTDIIIYSIPDNRFSHAEATTEYILGSSILSTSLDALTGDLDTEYPVSFDDPSFFGGKPYLGGFNSSHSYGIFNGTPLDATLDTSEFSGENGRRVFVNSARPIVDVTLPVCTLLVAARDQLHGGPLVFGTPVAQEITGECSVLADARYMRFRVQIPAGAVWRHARGVGVWRKSGGRV